MIVFWSSCLPVSSLFLISVSHGSSSSVSSYSGECDWNMGEALCMHEPADSGLDCGSGFLKLSIIDGLGLSSLCVWGGGCCPVCCRIFSSIPGLFPLDACSIPIPAMTIKNISKCFLGQHHPSLAQLKSTAVGWSVWAFSSGKLSCQILVFLFGLVLVPRKESSILLLERFLPGCQCSGRWVEEAGEESPFSLCTLALCVSYVQLSFVSSHPGNPLFYHFHRINISSAFCQGWGECLPW